MKKEKIEPENAVIGAADNDLAAENICNDLDMTYTDLQDLERRGKVNGKPLDKNV